MLYPPFKNFVRVSVCLSVRPSVRLRIVFTLLGAFLTNFLQTWYESRYCKGVFWDCRWVNFDK